MSDSVTVSAPAKINLTLHVTGQRADGYHLLDSLVVFAQDACDQVTVRKAPQMSLEVTGPRAQGVPADARNLCWCAAELFGETVEITLEKHLPHAAGIGGGSSDAAAVLRAMAELFDRALSSDPLVLGADVPVCLVAQAARVAGIGENVSPVSFEPLAAVLVNPGIGVPTPPVFAALSRKDNTAMTPGSVPDDPEQYLAWLAQQRNDLEAPARTIEPAIDGVLEALSDARLARMSGSGATCFGLYADMERARAASRRIQRNNPGWWVQTSVLS